MAGWLEKSFLVNQVQFNELLVGYCSGCLTHVF